MSDCFLINCWTFASSWNLGLEKHHIKNIMFFCLFETDIFCSRSEKLNSERWAINYTTARFLINTSLLNWSYSCTQLMRVEKSLNYSISCPSISEETIICRRHVFKTLLSTWLEQLCCSDLPRKKCKYWLWSKSVSKESVSRIESKSILPLPIDL